jgi:16S rRNA (cytidine1402-2'-O)-methyltransferase
MIFVSNNQQPTTNNMELELTAGILYIVATPIGNLEDMSFRAVRILQSVDYIAAEDTRHTGKLLNHFQIKVPQISYHEHNQKQRIPELLDKLKAGKNIAVVTDAGMPGISDPGYEIVKAAIDVGFRVVPIPGANAAITALSAAGLLTERFVFEGFLPSKGKERQQRLDVLETEARTIILYESPHRLEKTLADLANCLGTDRPIALGRELTKLHEEFWRGTIGEALSHYASVPPQGEFTLVIAGKSEAIEEISDTTLKTELENLLKQGMSRSEATKVMAEQTDVSRRKIYQLALLIPEVNQGKND